MAHIITMADSGRRYLIFEGASEGSCPACDRRCPAHQPETWYWLPLHVSSASADRFAAGSPTQALAEQSCWSYEIGDYADAMSCFDEVDRAAREEKS